MSIDYGRLTAKDRREIVAATEWCRDLALPMTGYAGWSKWAWVEADVLNTMNKAASILESLLMTDRRFR